MAIGWANNLRSIPTGPAEGDLDGTFPGPLVDGLQGSPVAADAPVNGDVLTFVIDAWQPSTPGGGGAPSGPAGGDLDGVYPDPLVVALRGVPISLTLPTAGQVLRETAGEWTPDTLDAADVGADPAGTGATEAAAAVAAHVALLDPHTQYTTTGEAAAAAPVQSVAGKTGAVSLVVADVSGAAPSNSPTLTGTVDASGATSVTVPTVAFPDNDTSAASTAYVAAAFANGALPLDYHATSRFTPASSTAPGLITYLTLNFTAVGGVYFLAGVGGLTGSSSTTQIRAALIIDSVNQGGPYLETGITNGVSILGTPSSFAFTAGPHTIDLAFEHAGGPGTTTSFFAVLQVWKVA